MSGGELYEPDAEEAAVTEPPRIPLRIWHWFIWTFVSICLLAISDVRSVDTVEPFGWQQRVHAIQWACVGGLVLTACGALVGILRQTGYPRELKWAPGHFVLVLLTASLGSTALSYALRSILGTPSMQLYLFTTIPLYALMAIVALFAIGSSPTQPWRSFFIGWILTLLVDVVLLLSIVLFNNILFSGVALVARLALLVLLGFAVCRDLASHPRPIYIRTWTHWAGIGVFFVATAFNVFMRVAMALIVPY